MPVKRMGGPSATKIERGHASETDGQKSEEEKKHGNATKIDLI